jgi:hypothetical protein
MIRLNELTEQKLAQLLQTAEVTIVPAVIKALQSNLYRCPDPDHFDFGRFIQDWIRKQPREVAAVLAIVYELTAAGDGFLIQQIPDDQP